MVVQGVGILLIWLTPPWKRVSSKEKKSHNSCSKYGLLKKEWSTQESWVNSYPWYELDLGLSIGFFIS